MSVVGSGRSPAEELARTLRQLKDRAGLSLARLATRSWCSRSSLERYLNGKVFPSRETVLAISDACGGDTPAVLELWELAWAAREDTRRGPAPDGAAPAQLPPDVQGFTGRSAELARLDALVAGLDNAGDPVLITAVAGTAGVGKTALALHWAHRVRDRYPDGQLYLNLRGYGPDDPLPPGQALDRFLRALCVSGDQIPLEVDERATRFRTEVSGRRMLIVLDNASSADQVRPLLPGTGTCAVLITSRDSLPALVAVDGAHRLDLDPLPLTDAVALLCRLVGPRAEADPDAVVALADQCSRLPLALRIAAERANTHPAIALTDLAAELTDYQRRLDHLETAGDEHAPSAPCFLVLSAAPRRGLPGVSAARPAPRH